MAVRHWVEDRAVIALTNDSPILRGWAVAGIMVSKVDPGPRLWKKWKNMIRRKGIYLVWVSSPPKHPTKMTLGPLEAAWRCFVPATCKQGLLN